MSESKPPISTQKDPNHRRYLFLKLLRVLNFIAMIVAFWPLFLTMEWVDQGQLANGLWPSALITAGMGLTAVIATIPLRIRQLNYQKQLAAAEDANPFDAADDQRQDVMHTTSNLAELEDLMNPIQDTSAKKDDDALGRHSAMALNEVDAYKAWKKQNRQYLMNRILGTVGINVIRVLLMLLFAIVFFALTYLKLGTSSAIASGVSALLLVLYAFDIPQRSYGDIFRSTHLTTHIVLVLVCQITRYFFRYPMQPDFHLYILFYLTFVYFLTRNQTNIDNLMRQGSRSLNQLPHGLRGFNAGLTSLLTLAFPVIYILRKPIATVLVFIWDTLIFIVTTIVEFLNSLMRTEEPIGTETVPPSLPSEPQVPAEEGGYWLRTIMTALVITLFIYILRRYGRQIISAIAAAFKKLIATIASLFRREYASTTDEDEGRYYTDYHMALDPRHKRDFSYRGRKKQWRKAYVAYRKQYKALVPMRADSDLSVDPDRYREAYRLALAWMDLTESAGLDESDTVREIAGNFEERLNRWAIANEDDFLDVTTAYEDLRYGGRLIDAQGEDFTAELAELENELERMASRL